MLQMFEQVDTIRKDIGRKISQERKSEHGRNRASALRYLRANGLERNLVLHRLAGTAPPGSDFNRKPLEA